MAEQGLLVDTNVILDLVANTPTWADWSQAQLERHALTYRLMINPVIYAELSIGYERIEDLEAMLGTTLLRVEPLPREALFLAGKAFQRYRKAKGVKIGVLPDFFIGAHAAVIGVPLLTRDPRRYRRYFPKVELIAP